MYAKGMTTNDIESHMRELYDIEISDSTISRITDKILPIVKEWQERPLFNPPDGPWAARINPAALSFALIWSR